MKVRQGFVSNSSSSSFLIYGICVGKTKYGKKQLTPEFIKQMKSHFIDEESDDYLYDFWDVNECLSESGLFNKDDSITSNVQMYSTCPWEYNCYFGRSFDDIGDDESGREFKENTKKVLEKIFTEEYLEENNNLGVYKEAWRD